MGHTVSPACTLTMRICERMKYLAYRVYTRRRPPLPWKPLSTLIVPAPDDRDAKFNVFQNVSGCQNGGVQADEHIREQQRSLVLSIMLPYKWDGRYP